MSPHPRFSPVLLVLAACGSAEQPFGAAPTLPQDAGEVREAPGDAGGARDAARGRPGPSLDAGELVPVQVGEDAGEPAQPPADSGPHESPPPPVPDACSAVTPDGVCGLHADGCDYTRCPTPGDVCGGTLSLYSSPSLNPNRACGSACNAWSSSYSGGDSYGGQCGSLSVADESSFAGWVGNGSPNAQDCKYLYAYDEDTGAITYRPGGTAGCVIGTFAGDPVAGNVEVFLCCAD